MRLTSIKLSGFKSFVDPTTIALPSNFTVVVGPNGCGKSNIIDAVRWVMGESTAGRLRGDAMTDVIFSGAAGRKPVAQASVELRFDNADGTIAGEYAAYAEIAVRRTVSRDGGSSFFLNGSKCRKRDITELFLGTGLGARSYAIIEQGMISQVIDAKPDELRVHLEEAAGITLYKERRRETVSRIAQTRENMERLQDLQGEVGRQLDHLRGQAETATQYRTLESSRDLQRANWLAAQFRQAEAQCSALSEQLALQQAAFVAADVEGLSLDARQEAIQADVDEAQNALAEAQMALHAAEAEKTRIEQSLVHAQAMRARQQSEHAEAGAGVLALDEQLRADQEMCSDLEQQLDLLESERSSLDAAGEVAAGLLEKADMARKAWQRSFEQVALTQSESAALLAREGARQEFVLRQQAELAARMAAIQSRCHALSADQQDDTADLLGKRVDEARDRLESSESDASEATGARCAAELQQQQQDEQLQQLRGEKQIADGQLAALSTLQGATFGQDSSGMSDWLAGQGVAKAPRLGEVLVVEPGWECAVETFLGPWLDAVVVPASERHHLEAAWNGEGRCWLVADGQPEPASVVGTLAAYVKGPALAKQLLSAVALERHDEALWWLDVQGRIQTQHGSALGLEDARSGGLLREQQLRQLEVRTNELAVLLQDAEQADLLARDALAQARMYEQTCVSERDAVRHQYSQLSASVILQQGKEEECRRRLETMALELADLESRAVQLQEESGALDGVLTDLGLVAGKVATERAQLDVARQALDLDVEHARHGHAVARERQQSWAMAYENKKTRLESFRQAVSRGQQQVQVFQQRLAVLDAGDRDGELRLEALQRELKHVVTAVNSAVQAATQTRETLVLRQRMAGEVSAAQRTRQRWLAEQRESEVQLRLRHQAAVLARENIDAQALDLGVDPAALAALLPDDIDAAVLAQELRAIEMAMTSLGAVNLAAIKEYEKAGERQAWLEGQQTDLADALSVLETAMVRIDRETRSRFKETLDKVSQALQALYPRLFGGGEAWLELVGDDMLDAGVALMARPPGKKVSALSLLSGGEKAMTAVALVFAIFQLNPAPFCLLDEVDAPLDEANVGRLAAMLQQMSDNVQFLAVSHNKSTMEAATQLCGVTMREPGVSRVVSVDLTEASRLAGAA